MLACARDFYLPAEMHHNASEKLAMRVQEALANMLFYIKMKINQMFNFTYCEYK